MQSSTVKIKTLGFIFEFDEAGNIIKHLGEGVLSRPTGWRPICRWR